MPVELIVPEVGESVTEVEIGKWLKQEGDAVNKDEPLVEIETDKVTLELPAPVSGTITQVGKAQGDQATVGDVIGLMEEGEGAPAGNGTAAPAKPEPAKEAPAPTPAPAAAAPAPAAASGGDPIVMPAAQRLIDQHGIALSAVTATGPGGRILKEDVQRVVDQQAAPAAPAPTPAPAAAPTPAPASIPAGDRPEEVVAMTPLRRTIAKHLVAAQQNGALLTTFNEVDMSAVMDLRKQYQDQFVKKYGFKLGFMSFFVKAVIDGLKAEPSVNAEIRGNDIAYKHYYDIGIAVGGGKGLVVPVVRNADRLSFAEVETTISELAKRARDNKLGMDELQGGTFTITNGGIYGSMMSTPIVNPPQSGVLGMHNIVKRPIVVTGANGKDEIAIRPMMYIALTYDHRLIDGREAVTFLKRVKEGIEDPTRLLIEV